MKITFDKSAINFVLGSFGNSTDKEGYIVDKTTKQRVISSDGDYIHKSEFAGITKGSKVYLKSDIASLIEFVEKFTQQK